MTPAELARIGREMYGPVWKPRLARAIGVSRATVWKWAADVHPIQEPEAKLIRSLHAEHCDRLTREMAKE
jgi:DNA-binding transcriptional regulator YiaG